MKRKDAIEAILSATSGTEAVVSSLGLISREIYECHDAQNRFYVPGSMGLASSIGIGLAVCQPLITVIVIDGDASLLMNLGTLVTGGQQAIPNYLHIVLDNGAYASCSEERTMSAGADIVEMARNAGYRYVRHVEDREALASTVREAIGSGPSFIRARIDLGGRRDFARPLELEMFKKRFMDFLTGGDNIR